MRASESQRPGDAKGIDPQGTGHFARYERPHADENFAAASVLNGCKISAIGAKGFAFVVEFQPVFERLADLLSGSQVEDLPDLAAKIAGHGQDEMAGAVRQPELGGARER